MNNSTLQLRLKLSLFAIISGITFAWLAMALGLSGDFSLSPENTKFALGVGTGMGILSLIIVNCLGFKDRAKSTKMATGIIIGLPLLIGAVFMLWVMAVSSI